VLILSNKVALAIIVPDQREKEDAAYVAWQQPVIRICTGLALVGVICDVPLRSGEEWIMKVLWDLVCHFPDANVLSLA
jgi:regulator of nonsense transcripts 2